MRVTPLPHGNLFLPCTCVRVCRASCCNEWLIKEKPLCDMHTVLFTFFGFTFLYVICLFFQRDDAGDMSTELFTTLGSDRGLISPRKSPAHLRSPQSWRHFLVSGVFPSIDCGHVDQLFDNQNFLSDLLSLPQFFTK